MSSEIHPTAIVDDRAKIGRDVEIGAYSIIGPDVVIGDGSKIGPHVVIEGHTTLGEGCRVFQFASIGAPPQVIKFKGEPSVLILGPRNTVRECVTIQPGTERGGMKTVIGENNLFMANSHVAHDCVVGNNNIFANSVALAGHVTIGNNANLGGMAGIHQFCRVGDYAMVGAGSMAAQDIPPYCIAQGDRCHLRGVNVIGLERGGFSAEDVKDVRRVFRTLFLKGGRLTDRLAEVPAEAAAKPHIKHLLDFIAGSSRGIAPMHRRGDARGDD